MKILKTKLSKKCLNIKTLELHSTTELCCFNFSCVYEHKSKICSQTGGFSEVHEG